MNNSFTLRQIAKKTNGEISIDIPALQRGLVWKPKQVEFLWDSILRGFPIGGFVLSESSQENKSETKPEGDKPNRKICDLMDGQQRFNAIKLGFEEPKEIRTSEIELKDQKKVEEKINSVLWIDLAPDNADIKKSTRKYFVKATTIAHPWGYNNDEECSRLSAGERQKALLEFGMGDKSMYNEEINLTETYPYKSQLPIPFAYIINSLYELSDRNNTKTFDDLVLEKCDKSECLKWKERFWNSENRNKLIKWLDDNFTSLISLKDYTVPFSLLSKKTIENEDKLSGQMDNNQTENENADNAIEEPAQTDLEILFQRLNTGGTRISNDDLVYSAIKAYWEDIKERNEELAKGLMPPQNLIQLILRLLLTDEKATNFEAPLTIKKIRDLSKNTDMKDIIIKFYNDNLQTNDMKSKLVSLTNSKTYSEKAIPKYVLMKIIKEKPDVILFALYLIKNNKLEGEKLIGLILYLYWFSINTNEVINKLFQKCKADKENSDSFGSIKKGIAELTYEKKMMNIYSPDELEISAMNDKYGNNLREMIDHTAEGKFLYPLMWNPQKNPLSKTLLLYAQRVFLNNNFSKFNPADIVAWEDHNCPWDYDHIFPQNKVNSFKQSQYRDNVRFWLWSIGNFAAIPYEENRSKRDNINYDYYKKHDKALVFEQFSHNFENMEPHGTDENEKSLSFENTVFKRMLELYKRCYESFNEYVPTLSNNAQKRKEFMQSLESKLQGKCNNCIPAFYFVREPNEVREYELTNERDWFRFCVSLKVNLPKFNNPDCMLSFTWNHLNGNSLEFGLRGLNSVNDKKLFLQSEEGKYLCRKIQDCMESTSFSRTARTSWTENAWWYKGYELNFSSENVYENIDLLSDLYATIVEKLNA